MNAQFIERLEARLFRSAGDIDTTFGTGGVAIADIGHDSVIHDSIALSSGKFVVAGSLGSDAFLTRFNGNGTLDTAFATGGIARLDLGRNESFVALALLPDGRFLLAGESSKARGFFARYRADGTLDTGNRFGDGAGYRTLPAGDHINAMTVTTDKIFVVDRSTVRRYNLGTAHADVGFSGDGRVDLFATTVLDEFIPYGITVSPSGKIAVGGYGHTNDATEKKLPQRATGPQSLGNCIAVLDASAATDNTFDTNGVAFYEGTAFPRLTYTSAGTLLVADSFHDFDFNAGPGLFRFQPDGTYAFTSAPGAFPADAIAIEPDGKVLALSRDGASRFNADYSLDLTYSTDGTIQTPGLAVLDPAAAALYGSFTGDSGGALVLPDQSIITLSTRAHGSNGVTHEGPLVFTKFNPAPTNLPITVQRAGNDLTVGGTEDDDSIGFEADGEEQRVVLIIDHQQFYLPISQITSVSVLLGSGNDSYEGSIEGATLFVNGEGGNDTISGGGGNDTLIGGLDADLIYGFGGDDLIYGNGGKDTLWGLDGRDSLDGGRSNDILYGGSSVDRLVGREGSDELYGEGGNDLIYSQDSARDYVFGGSGTDRALVDAGSSDGDVLASIETLL